MLKTINAFLLFLFLTNIATAQIEPEAIRQYPDKMQLSIINSYQDFNFSAGVVNNSSISYRNTMVKTGLRLRVGKVGLTFAVPVVRIHPNKSSLTENLAFSFNIYPKKINLGGSVRRVKGFDQENDGKVVFRPDVKLLHFETSGTYVFNKNFSLWAPFRYYERQMKNAGSFLVMGIADFKRLQAKDSLFHISQDVLSDLGAMNILSFGAGAGYGFTLTKGNWYFTCLLTGGGELNRRQYFDKENHNLLSEWKLKPVTIAQLSTGYNTDRYFLGLVSYFRPGFGISDNLDANFYRFHAALIAGIRFDTPKFLRKKK